MNHRAIELYLNNTLKEESVDPRIRPYLESAKKAIKDLNIKPLLIEPHLYHPSLLFAGTPDLLTTKNILIDWKTGSHMPQTELQLGGYTLLLEAEKQVVKEAYEIVLSEKSYKLFPFKPHRSRGLFAAALSIYSWRKRKNV